jgi:4-carboxymuconolactone decarboxylase
MAPLAPSIGVGGAGFSRFSGSGCDGDDDGCIPGSGTSVSRVGVEDPEGPREKWMKQLNNRERSLVSLGAALASNCVPCIEFHIPGAKRAGLSDREIEVALEIADKVRQVPARAVLETALARIETPPDETANTVSSECGCSGSDPTFGCDGVT